MTGYMKLRKHEKAKWTRIARAFSMAHANHVMRDIIALRNAEA